MAAESCRRTNVPNAVGDSPETFARAAPSPESPAHDFCNRPGTKGKWLTRAQA